MYSKWELTLIICIKTDLALDNLQRLIFHKTQSTTQRQRLREFFSSFLLQYLHIGEWILDQAPGIKICFSKELKTGVHVFLYDSVNKNKIPFI